MAVMNVNPTRMQLTKLKKQLVTAVRGHKMLKDKRDELMRRFLELIRTTRTLRERVDEALAESNRHFVNAAAVMSDEALDSALLSPKQNLTLAVETQNVMSVEIPQFTLRQRTAEAGDIYPYGFAFTSFELDDAVAALASLTDDLILLAQYEKSCERMAIEIEKTRRRVNALEHVLIPRYQETIKYITEKLEENDRSSRTRLMKVKDMLLDKAHGYSRQTPAN